MAKVPGSKGNEKALHKSISKAKVGKKNKHTNKQRLHQSKKKVRNLQSEEISNIRAMQRKKGL